MGSSSARCCNVSTAEKKAERRNSYPGGRGGTIEIPEVKSVKDYKADYEEKRTPISEDSKVFIVTARDTNGKYVCRRLPLNEAPCKSPQERAKHYQLLASVEHPHLCKFVEAFEDSTHMYLIYEKADPMRLFDFVRKRKSLTEDEAADYIRQASSALSVSHMAGVVHGRLSPRSFILAPGSCDDEDMEVQLKVCDLGQGFILRPNALRDEETKKTVELAKYALSPELGAEELDESCTGRAPPGAELSDMWSLGIICYHMLSGTTPFRSTCRSDVVHNVQSTLASFDSDMWKRLSPEAQDCVSGLLKVNPGIRLSASNLLRHPWIKVAKVAFPKKRMTQLLSNLRSNVAECEFKKFVLRVIAEHLPPEGKQATVVEQAFRCLDRNGDGVLTLEELCKGLKKYMDVSSEELKRLFEQVDRDGSGTLNVQEFVTVTIDQRLVTSLPILWQAFNAFDKDKGGEITFDEIESIVKEVEGALIGKDQVAVLAETIRHELENVSHKGALDFDQFVYLMRNSNPNIQDAITKDVYRALWNGCGIDCYSVRKAEITWAYNKAKIEQPRSAHSVYRKRDVTRRSIVLNGRTGGAARAG